MQQLEEKLETYVAEVEAAAAAAGVSVADCMEARIDEMEVAARAKLQANADARGISLEQYADELLRFESATLADARALGTTQEALVNAAGEAMRETQAEVTTLAEALRVPPVQVLAIDLNFREAARQQAPPLGLTEEEFVERSFTQLIERVTALREVQDAPPASELE